MSTQSKSASRETTSKAGEGDVRNSRTPFTLPEIEAEVEPVFMRRLSIYTESRFVEAWRSENEFCAPYESEINVPLLPQCRL